MNIIIVSYGYSPVDLSTSNNITSESRSAHNLVRCIEKNHSVKVITKDSSFGKKDVISVGSNETLRRVERGITNNMVGQLKLDYPCFARKAARAVKRLRGEYDVVQQISPISFRYPAVLTDEEKPFIWGPIGGSIPYPKGFDQIRKREPYLRQMRGVERVRLKIDPWLRRAFSHVSKILVTSEQAMLNVPQQYRYKSEVFPEGIHVDKVLRDAEDGEDEIEGGVPKDYIFTIGKLIPYKAIDIAIRAFARLNYTGVDLVITGDGPEMERLQRMVSALELKNRVYFMGKVNAKLNLALMKRSLFCVYPALKEAFGHVNLESMCLGKPIIVTDWGGSRDIVVHGATGYKVLERGIEEQVVKMSEYMRILLNDKDIRITLGVSAQQRVKRCYAWSALCERLERIYTEVSRWKGPRAPEKCV